MVTITVITVTIANGTIAASSTVTIYSTMAITNTTISSTSTMATGIGLFELRTVRENIISTTFVAFTNIITRRVDVIIFPLRRCCISFRNVNVSEGRPMAILENISTLLRNIPTNPNWKVFGIYIIIFHQTRVFEIILGLNFIGIDMLVKNISIGNLTWIFSDFQNMSHAKFFRNSTSTTHNLDMTDIRGRNIRYVFTRKVIKRYICESLLCTFNVDWSRSISSI